eukprot:scaffold137602_cov148-Phaeocystis_antarctica.AAC.1
MRAHSLSNDSLYSGRGPPALLQGKKAHHAAVEDTVVAVVEKVLESVLLWKDLVVLERVPDRHERFVDVVSLVTRITFHALDVAVGPKRRALLEMVICLDSLFDKRVALARSHLAHGLVLCENVSVSLLPASQTFELGPLRFTQGLNQHESGEAWQRHVLEEVDGIRVWLFIVVLDVVQRLELGQRRCVVARG